MIKITPEEQEIMAWGSEAFKSSWLDLCEIFQKLNAGEKLSRDEAMVDPYFVPFDIDGRVIYQALRYGGKKAVLGENGSMITIITNTRGNQIIWSSLEAEENGAYTEFYPLADRMGHEWDKIGSELVFDDDLKGAHEHFASWIKTQPDISHVDLGIVKVANVQFFGAFKKAYEDSDDGAKLGLLLVKMADAVAEVMENNWLRFYPDINLKKLLELVAPALTALGPVNKTLQGVLEKLPF